MRVSVIGKLDLKVFKMGVLWTILTAILHLNRKASSKIGRKADDDLLFESRMGVRAVVDWLFGDASSLSRGIAHGDRLAWQIPHSLVAEPRIAERRHSHSLFLNAATKTRLAPRIMINVYI
jgi:hypothetical protein